MFLCVKHQLPRCVHWICDCYRKCIINRYGIKPTDKYKNKVIVFEVPGAFEIPLIIKQTLDKYRKKNKEIYILALGCVIKGQTKHDEYISSTIINAIRNLSLEYNTLIINGRLTTLTIKQAIERAGIKQRKGKEYAEGLSVMSQLINKLR